MRMSRPGGKRTPAAHNRKTWLGSSSETHRKKKRKSFKKPSAVVDVVSLLRLELLVGVESLLMVSGGLLLSTTGYVGLSASSGNGQSKCPWHRKQKETNPRARTSWRSAWPARAVDRTRSQESCPLRRCFRWPSNWAGISRAGRLCRTRCRFRRERKSDRSRRRSCRPGRTARKLRNPGPEGVDLRRQKSPTTTSD